MMMKNYATVSSGTFYRFGSNGSMIEKKSVSKLGWIKSNGQWYYVRNGYLIRGHFSSIGNRNYYFGWDGVMVSNQAILLNGVLYYLSDNGSLTEKVTVPKKGWVRVNNNWYYIRNGALVKNSFSSIDGHVYHFDKNGVMSSNQSIVTGGVFYYMGANGILTKKQDVSKDCWIKVNSDWYYVKNKSLVRGNLIVIGKYTYYMYMSGKMAKNTQIKYYDSKLKKNVTYRIDGQGHVIK